MVIFFHFCLIHFKSIKNMNHLSRFFSLTALIVVLTSFTLIDGTNNEDKIAGFSEGNCTTSFGGNVKVNKLYDGGREIGSSIWINRSSKRVNAKYFAENPNNSTPYQRYQSWRGGKSVVLVSSGAYATDFNINQGKPVGLTVDNGSIVNRNYDSSMDGLVIVYATGGIVVSNIEDGNLNLVGEGTVDIKRATDRAKFLKWAEAKDATVFQTHLLAYDNQSKMVRDNGRTAVRKFLILAKSGGTLYHIIFYTKKNSYSLLDGTNYALNYLKGTKGMKVVAMLNLDTGGFDVLGTGL